MISVHGGIGATWEHDAPLYFRRAQLSRRLLGGTAGATDRVAGELIAQASCRPDGGALLLLDSGGPGRDRLRLCFGFERRQHGRPVGPLHRFDHRRFDQHALAGSPAVTVCATGCLVTSGSVSAGSTVSVTSSVIVLPVAFLKIASNLVPDSVVLVGGVV